MFRIYKFYKHSAIKPGRRENEKVEEEREKKRKTIKIHLIIILKFLEKYVSYQREKERERESLLSHSLFNIHVSINQKG
jgi:hypothetical protein